MGQIYEGMVLVDNDVVRADWRQAKALVTDTLTKYGATVHSARRWDERALAYPIAGRQRATYYLAYFELPEGNSEAMRRDFDLNERILRYLFTAVEELPEGEAALAAEEDGEEHVHDEEGEELNDKDSKKRSDNFDEKLTMSPKKSTGTKMRNVGGPVIPSLASSVQRKWLEQDIPIPADISTHFVPQVGDIVL